jgi:CPA2 family monovalent cation:H+ antiporter-2
VADLLSVGVMFAALAAAGVLATRLDVSVIPVYILVGMALSPAVAGSASVGGVDLPSVEPGEFVDLGAELGIVFLLLFLGMEFNLDRLLANRGRIGRAGTIDLGINFGAGLLLGVVLFGVGLPAVLVAGVVYISSSAIVTKSLIDLGWIANDEAEPMLGTLVYEDLFIAVYLAVVVAVVAGDGTPVDTALAVGVALAFVLALLVVVRFGGGLFERALQTDSAEHLVLRAVGVTVLVAGVALAVGVSEAVAAFFVGMGFGATARVERLEELLEPVRDVFAAVFFFWVGLETDPTTLPAVAVPVAVAVAVTTPTKLLSGYLGGRVFGLGARRSARTGLGMVPRGEFSLVLATVALSGAGGVLPEAVAADLYAFAVGYVLVMSVLGTLLMQYSGPFERAAVARLGE